MAESEFETTDISGLEILYPGTFNGVPFTREDLEGMVEAFEATKDLLPPRLQLSHDMRQRLAKLLFGDEADGVEGFPALGWPSRLYMRGEKLVADVAQVPKRLVEMIRSGAYRGRSGGVLFNVTVDGKLWPMVLDHIALLGDQAPAVPGLPDIALARDGATWERELVLTLTAEADGLTLSGAPDEEREPECTHAENHTADATFAAGDDVDATLARINALLDEAHGLARELVKGRTGAPVVAAYMRGYRERLTRIVRRAHATKENLAMADGTEPVGTAPAAGGVTISSADVLAAMLAAKLGLAPEDYGAIYAALTALIDGAPGEATEPAEPMTDGGGVVMETDPTRVTLARADLDALTAAVKRAQDEAASAKAAAAKIEIERAEEAAQRKADADIAARSLPASVRPVLIELARAGKDDLYQSVVETSKAVPTTEEGTSTGGVNLAAIEPTEMDARVAAMLGMTIEQFRAQKARDAGVALPAQGA